MNIDKVLFIIEKDVLDYIKKNKLDRKSRKRSIIDPRNFAINILYYRFNWTEEELADFLGRSDRSTIWHAKNQAFYLRNDPTFIVNTKHIKTVFSSWEAPEPEKNYFFGRKKNVLVKFTKEEYEMIDKVRKKTKSRNFSTIIKKIVLENLDKYE